MEIKYQEIYETPEEEKDFDLINSQNLQRNSLQFFTDKTNPNIITDSLRTKEIFLHYARMDQNPQKQINFQISFNDESPVQRAENLKLQIKDLNEQLSVQQEQANNKEQKDIKSYLKDIKQIQNDLQNVCKKSQIHQICCFQNQKLNGNYEILNYQVQKELTAQILNNLQIYNQDQQQILQNSNIKFEIYLNKQTQDFQRYKKQIELEQQIVQLENFIGNQQIQPEEKSLTEKLQGLDSNFLHFGTKTKEDVQKKIIEINVLSQNYTESNTFIDLNATELSKISELHLKQQSTKQIQNEITHIVDRFEYLQNLHEQSSYIFNQINDINRIHSKMLKSLNKNQSYLQQVFYFYQKLKVGSQNNFKTIQNNFENINERFSKIQK